MPLARRLLMIKRVTGRIPDDAGFGLVELMIALTTLTVAIGALLALFASSMIALNHSGKEGTAITLADRQLESYRAMPFSCIPNSTLADPNPGGCGTYNGFPNPYAASQTTTTAESPDNRIYTVTTAVTSVGNSTQIKVTVALASGGPVLAQETSFFSSAGTATT